MAKDNKHLQVRVSDLSAALDALPAAFVIYDKDDRIIVCNESYRHEYHPFEHHVIPGTSLTELQWLRAREGLDAKAEGREAAFVEDEQNRHHHGPEVEEWRNDQGRHIRLLRARLANGSVVGMRFDITDLRNTQDELERQNAALQDARETLFRLANVDDLTGLTNRRAATDELRDLIAHCQRINAEVAILQIDLDGFKQVNDVHGHDAGDYVLVEVAKRLRDTVPGDAMVVRLGGDEFQVGLCCTSGVSDIVALAERIVAALRQPYLHQDRRCLIGASIGIAVSGSHDVAPDLLVKSADMALYKSKRDGRSRVSVFNNALRAETIVRDVMARGLLAEDLSDQLVTYLQPIVSAKDHAIVAAEALVRWHHPQLGILGPDQFLPVAEGLRTAARIDAIILQDVLKWRERWLKQGLAVPPISINMSSQRLCDRDLLPELAELDIPQGAICFEILETVFSQRDNQTLCSNLIGLRDLGFELQIDDYGTAHSSISGLLLIRPQRLKIDKQFALNILTDQESRKIVQLTVALAHELNIRTTAEGVETLEQAKILKELKCDRLQGFLFAKPCPSDQFSDLLKSDQTQPA